MIDLSLSVLNHMAQKITYILHASNRNQMCNCSVLTVQDYVTIYTLGLLNPDWADGKERNNNCGRMMSCVWRIQL
jgi:hypothetical protein